MNKHSSPYNPQGNGIVERVNRTLKNNIRILYQDGLTLKECLEKTLYAYNTTVHSTTEYSPYELMFGRKPNSHLQLSTQNEEVLKHGSNDNAGRKRLIAERNIEFKKHLQNKYLLKKKICSSYFHRKMLTIKLENGSEILQPRIIRIDFCKGEEM